MNEMVGGAQSTVSSQIDQLSCYDVICNHQRYLSERMLIEEDDIFKIYCDKIGPDDYFCLQLVTSADEYLQAPVITSPEDGAGIDQKQLDELFQSMVNEQGLLVLAKSEMKLAYLI